MLNSKRNLRHQFFFLLIHISCLLQKCILLSTTLFPQSCVFSSVSSRRFLCPCVFIQVLCLCLCLSFCLPPFLSSLSLGYWVRGLFAAKICLYFSLRLSFQVAGCPTQTTSSGYSPHLWLSLKW